MVFFFGKFLMAFKKNLPLCHSCICGQSLEGPPAAVLVALARVQAVLGARARTVAAQRPPAVPSYVAVGRRGRHLAIDQDQ